MTFFMLDADVAIFAMTGDERVGRAIRAAGKGGVRMSALVHSQILQGVPLRPNPALEMDLIEAFAVAIDVVPYDIDASLAYGRLISAIGFSRRDVIDRMIAAHAISLNATLVTNNVRDFADIPGLKLTNWAEP